MNTVSIQINHEADQPKYLQLFDSLKNMILKSDIKSGEKLPSVRVLANELKINNVTVINAYKQLESNGYISAKKGSGYYVSKVIENEEKSKHIYIDKVENHINFASATPHPEMFPIESFKECINEAIDRDGGYAFGYQESNGFIPLRESLADFLMAEHGIEVSYEAIQIVSGAQQGIDLISKILITPGDYVLTENPTYEGAIEAFKSRGGRVVGCELETDGINVEDLEKKIRICRPKFIYVMTKYQNPSTICYSKEKLDILLQLAKKYDFYIVEDDSMSELFYNDELKFSLKKSDNDDRVIYIKSFSKLLMPGLRIGCLVLPKALLKDFTRVKQSTDISSSGLIQRALDLYFRKGKWNEHIKYMRQIYRGKYEVMISNLQSIKKYSIDFDEPRGGLYFWIKLPKNMNAQKIAKNCFDNGLFILASDIFYPNAHRYKDSFVRLSFATAEVEDIKRGIGIFEMVIRNDSEK